MGKLCNMSLRYEIKHEHSFRRWAKVTWMQVYLTQYLAQFLNHTLKKLFICDIVVLKLFITLDNIESMPFWLAICYPVELNILVCSCLTQTYILAYVHSVTWCLLLDIKIYDTANANASIFNINSAENKSPKSFFAYPRSIMSY